MTDPQPDVRWAPIPPKPNNRGRIWLIVGLSVLAIAIVAALLFFLIPRGETTDPEGSASPTPSVSVSPSETATTPPSTEPEQTAQPVETPPAPADPSVDAFRAQVEEWLGSAITGLDIVSTESGQEALTVMDSLDQDAQRLAVAAAPASMQEDWSSRVDDYIDRLGALRSAVTGGGSTGGAVDDARSALQELRSMVGL
jgi:hypothetical protein